MSKSNVDMNRAHVSIEIIPKFLSAWDFSKAMDSKLNNLVPRWA